MEHEKGRKLRVGGRGLVAPGEAEEAKIEKM